MPRFRSKNRTQKWRCSVPDCTCEWITAQIGKLCFCEEHVEAATTLYEQYKATTAQALLAFDTALLQQAADERALYSATYLSQPDARHDQFVQLLREVSSVPLSNRAYWWQQQLRLHAFSV